MNKRSLVVLSICLVLGAGVVGYVWANGCCDGDALCNGDVVHQGSCNFYFTVDHDNIDPMHAGVKVYVQKDGDLTAVGYLMTITGESPYPVCVEFHKTIPLDANSTYYYYFICLGCGGRDPDEETYTLLTGDCD